MKHTKVESSDVREIGFESFQDIGGESPDHGILEVLFTNDTLYQYWNVPRTVYDAIMADASKGKAPHQLVRLAGYGFQFIEKIERAK